MIDFNFEDDWEPEAEEEMSCPYGFEFCSDPDTRDMGLCTTDCRDYLGSIEEDALEPCFVE